MKPTTLYKLAECMTFGKLDPGITNPLIHLEKKISSDLLCIQWGLSRYWDKKVFFLSAHPPPGPPLDPACFMIEGPSQNRLASTAYFAKPAALSLLLLLTTVKYKIYHNSKTKRAQKNSRVQKTAIRTLGIYWDRIFFLNREN